MHNPEKYEDGWSYERSSITSWLTKPGVNGRSPMEHRRYLGIPQQNTQLKRDIMQWLAGRNRTGYPLPLGRPVLIELSGSGSPISFITISGRDVTGLSLMFDVWYMRGMRISKQSLLHGEYFSFLFPTKRILIHNQPADYRCARHGRWQKDRVLARKLRRHQSHQERACSIWCHFSTGPTCQPDARLGQLLSCTKVCGI